jgi:type I restriction enzyme, S subunit
VKTGWQKITVGEAFTTATGGTPPKIDDSLYGDYIPFVKPPELTDKTIDTAADGLSRAGAEVARTLPANSILISCIGNLGKVGLNTIPVAFNQQINAILPNEQVALPWFMFYQVLGPTFKEKLEEQASGTTVPIVNKSKFNSIPIVLPCIEEQRRIVTLLDEAFADIAIAKANAEKNLQNARELFESQRQLLLQPKDDWHEATLADLCNIKHGYAFEGEYFSDAGDHVLLTPGSFFETGGFRDRGEKTKYFTGLIPSNYVLNQGDLLVAMTEQAAGLLGSPLLVPESNRFLHNQRLGLVTGKPNIPWTNTFFFHVFNLEAVRKAIHASASGAKVRHTSPGKVGAVKVVFPNNQAEQLRIAAQVKEIEQASIALQSIYRQKLTALDDLKKSLLHQAFRGQL